MTEVNAPGKFVAPGRNFVHSRRIRNFAVSLGLCLTMVDDTAERAAGGREPVIKLEDFLPHRLNVCSNLVSTALSRIYADYRIGVPEWRVIVTLGESGMMTAKAIGAHSFMHKTKVSRAVAQLEKRKLIARKANRADLREAFLSLTPAGRDMYEEIAPVAMRFADRLLATLGAADRAALERALTTLIEKAGEPAADIANPRRGR